MWDKVLGLLNKPLNCTSLSLHLFPCELGYATIWCPCPGLSSADPTGEYGVKKIFSVIERKMAHPETGGVRTTEDESEKLETSSEDEEIMIPSQDKAEARNLDIRDEHSENTQREDCLLLTEPWHGARPQQTGAEHPPATKDSILKNAADIFGTLRLPPERRVDMKKEVFTPPGGGGGPGGRQVPDPRGAQSEAQAMSKTVPEDTVRLNSGKGQRKFKSPVEMLANTVAERFGHTPG